MNRLLLLTITIALFVLAVFGAGVFAGCTAAVAVLLTAVGCFGACRTAREAGATQRAWTPGQWAAVGIIAFLLLTLLPIPLHASLLMGPRRLESQLTVADALETAAELQAVAYRYPFFSLARNRAGALRIAVLAIAAFGAMGLVALLPAQRRKACAAMLLVLGVVIAAAGIANRLWYPQGDTLWWLFPIRHGLPGPMACFVNRNHFGGLLAILSPLALVLCVECLARKRIGGGVCAAIALTIMSAALFLSLSRGAMVAYMGAMLLTAGLLLRRSGVWIGLLAVLALALLGFGITRIPHPVLQQRMQSLRHPLQDGSLHTRVEAWSDTFRIWRAYPLLGAGANGYRTVYSQHRRTSVRGFRAHAENEYVQLVAEGGLAGVGLFVVLCVAVVLEMRRSRGVPGTRSFRIAALGALVAAGIHALVDFPLRVPLYSVLLAVLVALSFELPDARARSFVPHVLAFCAAMLLFPFWRSMRTLDSTPYIIRAPAEELARGLTWAPTSWRTWYYFGRTLARKKTPETRALGEACMTQAAMYDPNNYVVWRALVMFRLRLGDLAGAREAHARVRQLRSWVPLPDIPEE